MKLNNVNHNVTQQTIQLINSLRGKDKIRVLFVCLGNICRSPAAEGVFKKIVEEHGQEKSFIIDSAGTGDWHIGDLPDKRMRVHASRRGYNLTHRARQFRNSDFDDFDLIITMDHNNMRNVSAMSRTEEDSLKIVPMSMFFNQDNRFDHVPDPYYEGSEGFELVLDLLEEASENLYTCLI